MPKGKDIKWKPTPLKSEPVDLEKEAFVEEVAMHVCSKCESRIFRTAFGSYELYLECQGCKSVFVLDIG